MKEDYLELILRIGVAFALTYPAVSGFYAPLAWVGYFPPFLQDLLGENLALALHSLGIVELVLALWILAGRAIFIPSVLATLLLFLIVVFNFSLMDILFRDIPIMLMAIVLALRHYPGNIARPAP